MGATNLVRTVVDGFERLRFIANSTEKPPPQEGIRREKGFSGIKLVPFLLRVPKILVVNESGDFFYATLPGLLRFLYQRVRFGPTLRIPGQTGH